MGFRIVTSSNAKGFGPSGTARPLTTSPQTVHTKKSPRWPNSRTRLFRLAAHQRVRLLRLLSGEGLVLAVFSLAPANADIRRISDTTWKRVTPPAAGPGW